MRENNVMKSTVCSNKKQHICKFKVLCEYSNYYFEYWHDCVEEAQKIATIREPVHKNLTSFSGKEAMTN